LEDGFKGFLTELRHKKLQGKMPVARTAGMDLWLTFVWIRGHVIRAFQLLVAALF